MHKDYPPFHAVCHHFRTWSAKGWFAHLLKILTAGKRASMGLDPTPDEAVLDSQSVRSARQLQKKWGHSFESAVGAYIVRQAFIHRFEVFYWRDRNLEVDCVIRKKGILVALEVKSNSINSSNELATDYNKCKY